MDTLYLLFMKMMNNAVQPNTCGDIECNAGAGTLSQKMFII